MTRSLTTALAAILLAAAPLFANGTPAPAITLNLPTLPAGKTLTIEYDTTVHSLGGDLSDLSTKATITADGGISVETDDPGTAALPPDDPTTTPVFENAPPTAGNLVAGNVGLPDNGATSYPFSVEFTDDGVLSLVDVSTIDVNDVVVTGPGGPLTVVAASEPTGTDGTPRTATYTVTPPGGSWDGPDNGTYQISLAGMQVADTGTPALFVAAGALGSFEVAIPVPSFSIAAADADKPEGNGATTGFTFTVTRGGDTSAAGSVAYTVTGDVDAGDFGSPLGGTVDFAAGASSAPLDLQVLGDGGVEPDEAFTVSLGNPQPAPDAIVGTPASADGVIRNDDSSLAIAATDADKAEGGAGTTAFTFTVTRSGYLDTAASVNFAVTGSGGDPADGADFGGALPTGIVDFAAAEPAQVITVNVSGDSDLEPDEGFTVTLSGSSGPGITTATAAGAIRNDDVLTVEIAATDDAADENTPAPGNFRISRNSSAGSLAVQIQLDPAATATPAVDFGLGGVMLAGGAGSVTIPAGQTFVDISLDPIDDIPAEAAETATLQVVADPGYAIGTASATVTIAQNDFVVTNTSDFTPGSAATPALRQGTLRQAIENANALGGNPTIDFRDTDGTPFSTTPQTILLTSRRELSLTEPATIDGPASPGRVTLDAGGFRKVLAISRGAGGSTLSRLTITGGEGSPGIGGGLFINVADTTLVNCIIEGNSAGLGGGVAVRSATLNLIDTIVHNNHTTHPTGEGGGIYGDDASVRMRGSTISDNEAAGGGGISVDGWESIPISAINCTISGNRAAIQGGGILVSSANPGLLDHVTITDNHVDSDMSGEPDQSGGGIRGATVLHHSIVAGNFRDGVGADDLNGSVTAASSYNLIGADTGLSGITGGSNGNQIGTAGSPIDPLLGPLAGNGGPTPTHALLPGSPAIDAGDPAFDPNAFMPPLDFDQRGPGFARVINGTIDIGAYEVPNVPPMVAADNPTVTVAEGGEATNTGTFSDSATDTVVISADTGAVTQTGSDSGTWSWSHTPVDGPAMFTVTITATDSFMEQTTTTFDVVVNNVAPTVVLDPVYDISENGVVSLSGTVSDPGTLDNISLAIDWGDPLSPGDMETINLPASATGSQTFALTHRYLDDNPSGTAQDNHSIFVLLLDDEGASAAKATPVTIRNVAPVITRLEATPGGAGVVLSVDFTDPGAPDRHTVQIAWGDGSSTPLTLPVGARSFQATHTYPAPAPAHTITVTITDDDTGSVTGSTGPPPPAGGSGIDEVEVLAGGDIRLGFSATPGDVFRIEYSHDLATWTPVVPDITATGNRVVWTDEGPPATASHPSTVPQRFYRFTRLPAPP